VYQPLKKLNVLPSSRAGSLLQVDRGEHIAFIHRRSNVGAGLLAKAVVQSPKISTGLASSRASSLPQFLLERADFLLPTEIQCGSEPARESGVSVNADVGCNGPFASKPAPTVFYWSELTFYSRLKSSVGASLLAKAVYQPMQMLAAMAPSRASSLPQLLLE